MKVFFQNLLIVFLNFRRRIMHLQVKYVPVCWLQ